MHVQRCRIGAAALVAALLLAACSSDGDTADDGGGTGTSAEPTTTVAPDGDEDEGTMATSFTGKTPDDIAPPPAEGNGMNVPQPAAAPPEGWVQEELLVGGTATSFEAVDTPGDGAWTVRPADEAEYRTRVIVRRPADPEDFSGTVVVEWFNVSAIEASPDWAYLADEIGREGHAYIGVSAQAQSVEGGNALIPVDIEDSAAAEAAGGTVDASGLKHIDPERYGTLTHPGDEYSYDLFAQIGRSVKADPSDLLGDLVPTQVIAMGESQSAIFLTSFVNGVHPLDPVYDSFLVHSRAAIAAPFDGTYLSASQAEDPAAALAAAVRIRTDLDVPVFIVVAETDLTLLGYAAARQEDTDLVRTWEIAGTAHADAHFVRAIVGGPRDPAVGELLGCSAPVNTGPHHEVLQAALHHLVAWTAGGDPPPAGTPIEVVEAGDGLVTIARGEDQIALGGVRNPLVDVPVAATIGDPPGGGTLADLASDEGGLCVLFGQTFPFDQDELVARYGTADEYLGAFRASAEEAVAGGFLLPPDAEALVAEAEANAALFP